MAPFKKSGGGFRGGGGERSGGFRSGGGDRPHFANKSFSRDNDRGGRDDRPVQMFQATCAECGKKCEVPFRPNGEKPVFCRDCFALKRGGDGDDRRGGGNSNPRDFTPRDYDRPAPASRPQPDSRIDDLKRQMDAMSKKLDTVAQMIEGLALTSSPVSTPSKPKKEKPEPSLAKVVGKVAKKAAKSKKQ